MVRLPLAADATDKERLSVAAGHVTERLYIMLEGNWGKVCSRSPAVYDLGEPERAGAACRCLPPPPAGQLGTHNPAEPCANAAVARGSSRAPRRRRASFSCTTTLSG